MTTQLGDAQSGSRKATIAGSAVGVSVHGLQKAFGKDGLAVDIDELEIRPGEFVTLVGPSGCGKTTTMRMIVGLEQPTRGEIRFGGRVVNEVPVQKRNVAMVFQNYALYPHLCVRDNLAYGLKKRGFPKAERETRVARVADMLHIGALLDRKPRQLSGGEQQRVALGRAIVREPTVLLLDEPLSNLDAKLRAQMRGELVRLQRRVGYTTIYVTHDQLEAMTMSDRIAVMQAGKVQQFDRPERIYGAPANLFVASFMGNPPMNLIAGTLSDRADCLEFSTTGAEFALHEQIRGQLSASPATAREVVLGVRPEDISLSATAGNVHGEVILVELVGAEKHITLECGSGAIVTRVEVDYPVDVGDRLYCAFRAQKVHVFGAGDGAALC